MNICEENKKFLIICRVENFEKAPSWAFSNEKYDCFLSQYGDKPDDKHHYFSGGKWAGIYDFVKKNPELTNKYKYIWLPDDDIETTEENIRNFFELCIEQKIELAQPALTPESVYAYRLTIANPRFQFRLTNFVELMIPLFEINVFKKILPLFENKHAGLGLDWMWCKYTAQPNNNVVIVDKVAMGHYRERSQYLAGKMKKDKNIDILEERKKTFLELNIKKIKPRTHQGRLLSGEDVKGWRLSTEMILGYFSVRDRFKKNPWRIRNYIELLNSV